MFASREKLGVLLGFLGMCLFAGTLPATRLALTGLDPLFLTVARGTIAGCAAGVVLLLTRRTFPPRWLWLEMSAAAFCTALAFPLLAAFAMTTVPAAHGGVVLGILPLATAAAAALLAHERPSGAFWFASASGAALVLIFVFRRSGGESVTAGDFFLLGTVVVGAIGYTLSGRLTRRLPGWEVISWQVVLLLPLAAAATFAFYPNDIARVPIAAWGGLVYVGLVSQYTAFFVFNAAMAIGGIARVAQIMLLQPFVTILLAALVNGEPIDLETILFAAGVVAAVLLAQRTHLVRRI
jgi:drug/metabolite transporter (DMT)-like permease